MENAIETRALTKHFSRPRGLLRLARRPPVTAVDDVHLRVEQGEIFGLLGPNGAGKTTLVKMLCTLILPTAGSATVAGHPLHDDAAIRAAVGLVVGDERSFYWRLTGRQNLAFFAAMVGFRGRAAEERVQTVLEAVDMQRRANDRFGNYSSGMKQRMAIARSLLHHPRILFLDEPSRSLDPVATNRLHDLMLNLVEQQGVTIFLITHDLLEAEKLCRRVAVMHRGRIRAVDSPAALRQQLARRLRYTVRTASLPPDIRPALRRIVPDTQIQAHDDVHHLHFSAGEADGRLTAVLDLLHQYNVTIYTIQGDPPTFDEVFAQLTRDEPAST